MNYVEYFHNHDVVYSHLINWYHFYFLFKSLHVNTIDQSESMYYSWQDFWSVCKLLVSSINQQEFLLTTVRNYCRPDFFIAWCYNSADCNFQLSMISVIEKECYTLQLNSILEVFFLQRKVVHIVLLRKLVTLGATVSIATASGEIKSCCQQTISLDVTCILNQQCVFYLIELLLWNVKKCISNLQCIYLIELLPWNVKSALELICMMCNASAAAK